MGDQNGAKKPKERGFSARNRYRQNRAGLVATPTRGAVAEEERFPTNSWSVEETAKWKRANGFSPPNESILEPGYAGEIDNEELYYIWEHIQANRNLARQWGIRVARTRVPAKHIRMVALHGE